MTNLLYANQYITTTLSVAGGIDDSQTTGIVLASTASLDCAKPGMALATYADPLDTSVAEWIEYTSINSSTKELEGVTRGSEGFSAKAHSNGAAIAFPLTESHINRIVARLTGDVANSVNYVQQTDAATGNAPVISATGGDDKIPLGLAGKAAFVKATGIYDCGTVGAAETVNWANGDRQLLTLDENLTITFSNATVGQTLTLYLLQDGSGTNTIAWADTIVWQDGITWGTSYYTTTANKWNTVVISCPATGVYLGNVSKYA